MDYEEFGENFVARDHAMEGSMLFRRREPLTVVLGHRLIQGGRGVDTRQRKIGFFKLKPYFEVTNARACACVGDWAACVVFVLRVLSQQKLPTWEYVVLAKFL